MPKETLLPIYPPQSPHRPRHPYPMHPHNPRPQQQQQPPPSSAAAKAAAAAKALHRRALDRAQQKQSQPPSHADPRWEQRHDDGYGSNPKTDDRRRSTMAVFRRSPSDSEEKSRSYRMEGYSARHPPPPAQHPVHSAQQPSQSRPRRREDEYGNANNNSNNWEQRNDGHREEKSDNPAYPPMAHYPYGAVPPGYPMPPNYPYAMPPPYEDEEKAPSNPPAPPVVYRPRDEYARYGYYDGYYDPNYAAAAANAANAPQYPPPYYGYGYPQEKKATMPPQDEKRVKYQDEAMNPAHSRSDSQSQHPPPPHPQPPPPSRTTRRIIGSHTPIHVPRAEDSPPPHRHSSTSRPSSTSVSTPAPAPSNAGRASVFRSQDILMSERERDAHEILLSLSKSFDKGRPKSPEEPPRLKHFHKEKGDGFEPQPSPLRPTPDENDIEFAPSFTLFNQSFDMNLDTLLGPNASFGLGPMKSLSFGLGLGSSIDYSDNPRTSPMSIHRAGSRVGKSDKGQDGENVQVLRASPSNSFGNVVREAASGGGGGGDGAKKGVMVLGDSVRVTSPSAIEKKRSRSPSPKDANIVLDGNARKLPFRLKDEKPLKEERGEDLKVDAVGPTPKRLKMRSKSSRVDVETLKVLEHHQSIFAGFSFLLPGAKAILAKAEHTYPEVEIARRRVNSALCAFGGSALPKKAVRSEKTASRQKYEELLPERYYEDDSRLSWEVEEDPPVEVSDEEDEEHSATPNRGKSTLSCDSTDGSYGGMSLQRNMGVMVYPAVNAFMAAEPGVITPALSEMNNFVSGKKSPECTPGKAQTQLPVSNSKSVLPLVSPDSVKLGPDLLSGRDDKNSSVNYAGGAWISNHQSQGQSMLKKGETAPGHLFVDTQELVFEQYRIITRKKTAQSYDYPALPVPYAQRKRMSNAVFALSKSIPGLTDECAVVLSEARKKDAWDFAVAELMTQVIVLTHCEEGDWRLDGLSKYLLTLGIAC
eukprot:CCRYP_015658-RA/>CCRYP_015658-RA protein AED:0.39 eAED:0.39 QI:594/1/1/1/0.5/0.2/5/1373/978